MQEQMSLDTPIPPALQPKSGSAHDRPIDPQLVIIRSVLEQERATPDPKPTPRTDTQTQHRTPSGRVRGAVMRPVLSFLKNPKAPRYLTIALLCYAIIAHTGIVIILAVMSGLLALVIYFSIGPERVWHWGQNRYQYLSQCDPEAAERLRSRAATASRALGAVVDRLPESWTQGLYLPDFDEPDENSEKWKSDPFHRLAKEKAR